MEIYYRTGTEARNAGELEQYRASYAENVRTAHVIDSVIRAKFDGIRLPRTVVADVLQEADPARVALVLAATLDERDHDGRFSRTNREWAARIRLPEIAPDVYGTGRAAYTCRTHSAVLDGFIGQFRQHIDAQ